MFSFFYLGFANLDFGHSKRRSGLSALAFNAYTGLEKITQPLHGKTKRTVLLIFKHLLPGILMIHRGSSDIAPRGLTVIREHTLHFVKHIMSVVSFGKKELDVKLFLSCFFRRAKFWQKIHFQVKYFVSLFTGGRLLGGCGSLGPASCPAGSREGRVPSEGLLGHRGPY